MKKTLIALTTSLVLASGAAFAQSSVLDVQSQPNRSTSQDLLPNFSLSGGTGYTAGEFSAANSFGDESPETDRAAGIDYRPTAAIGTSNGFGYGEFSAENGFGDESPEPQVLGN